MLAPPVTENLDPPLYMHDAIRFVVATLPMEMSIAEEINFSYLMHLSSDQEKDNRKNIVNDKIWKLMGIYTPEFYKE